MGRLPGRDTPIAASERFFYPDCPPEAHGEEAVRVGIGRKVSSRDLGYARAQAEDALQTYAGLLKFWNAPDDEHTRLQLRGLVEDCIEIEVPDRG